MPQPLAYHLFLSCQSRCHPTSRLPLSNSLPIHYGHLLWQVTKNHKNETCDRQSTGANGILLDVSPESGWTMLFDTAGRTNGYPPPAADGMERPQQNPGNRQTAMEGGRPTLPRETGRTQQRIVTSQEKPLNFPRRSEIRWCVALATTRRALLFLFLQWFLAVPPVR